MLHIVFFPVQAAGPRLEALHREWPAWMSEGSGEELKPTNRKRETDTGTVDRPRRQTRKEIDYSRSGEGSATNSQPQLQGEVGGVTITELRQAREVRDISIESIWGDSHTESWSPQTVARRTDTLVEGLREVKQQLTMAKKEEVSMTDLMAMMLEMGRKDKEEARRRETEREERAIEREEKRLRDQADREEERRREDDRREDRRIQREQREREAAAEREVQLIATLKAAQPTIPQTVYLDNTKLPSMSKGEDVEMFLELFESALVAGNVPEDKRVQKLHAALDSSTKLAIRDTITNPDTSYKDIKQALIGQTNLTFACASESIVTLDNGGVTKLPVRQAVQRMTRYFDKISAEATTIHETCMYAAIATLRVSLAREVKQYVDVKGSCDSSSFCCSIEEWQKSNPGRPIWGGTTNTSLVSSQKQTYRPAGQPRKVGDCYHCGKAGHYAAVCRSRLAGVAPAQPRHEGPGPVLQPAVTAEAPRPGRQFQRPLAETTCFSCHQKGHISPNCPSRKSKVKKVRVETDHIENLKYNEVFGSVGPHRMPITMDTGAEITVVPEEAVHPDQFTGDTCELWSFNNTKSSGRKCRVEVSAGNKTFTREAVTQPGVSLGWSVCLSMDLSDATERDFLMEKMTERASMPDHLIQYIPPEVREGVLISGLPITEAKIVKGVTRVDSSDNKKESDQPQPLLSVNSEAGDTDQNIETRELGTIKEESSEEVTIQVEEAVDKEVVDGVLGDERSLEIAEEGGESLGGSAEQEGLQELHVGRIREGMPVERMVSETDTDPSLVHVRKLALMDKEGYHMSNGLIFRTRLDTFGTPVEQLCVPASFRQQCLKAAHSIFGHPGCNRMVALLRPHFYWPCMGKDCLGYVKSCAPCQQMDKTVPRPNPMTEREVVTRPFSDVAVDVVGPFPTAKGGYKFLITCIDSASRWPEAFPVRKATAKTVIGCLKSVFVRWGFPEKLTSDNGSQFAGKEFSKWLRDKGIAHARATPYHPQGNGVVERLHRTLNGVLAKTIECKGDWAAVLPMALFFLRLTPSSSTGISPFLLTHGWEPPTPVQLLYKAWVDKEVGGADLTEWVLDNADRIERARDKASATLIENSRKRTEAYNRKAKTRDFEVGDSVWVRKPGVDHKLKESWVGPGTVLRKNSPVSFRVQTPERTLATVNIQQLKLAHNPGKVKKITTVVEDTNTDHITDSFASATVENQELTSQQQQQLDEVLQAHENILTKEPGLTHLVKFDIDTGGAEPIHQRPYSTPIALKASVDAEIDWLLEKKYIVPSSSPWASPMVTVRKADGSARLCVDFRRINSLTRQQPFFMPRVEEVVEGIGRAKFISKLDLTKGFYQVELTEKAKQITAFTCHRGAFHFTRMPFGMKNAPACFQALMQRVLGNVKSFATPYMDDVVIFSENWDDHVKHIEEVLTCIGEAGLTVNPKKCCWGGKGIEFLGHTIGKGNMSIPEHRATALSNNTRPKTKRGLRAFLGSVSFYRRYLDKLATWTSILTPKTSKQAPSVVEWTGEDRVAFSSICNFFCSHLTLCVPVLGDKLSIVSDASGRGIGGVLQVQRDGEWCPAAYFSRQLRGAEHRYSATELEALALTETIRHFSYHLYGQHFTAYTDHRPLEQLTRSTRLNARLARMAFKLQPWMMDVVYLPGNENTLADDLSREEWPSSDKPIEDTPQECRLVVGDVEAKPPQEQDEH